MRFALQNMIFMFYQLIISICCLNYNNYFFKKYFHPSNNLISLILKKTASRNKK